jgi:hypothetical protein
METIMRTIKTIGLAVLASFAAMMAVGPGRPPEGKPGALLLLASLPLDLLHFFRQVAPATGSVQKASLCVIGDNA